MQIRLTMAAIVGALALGLAVGPGAALGGAPQPKVLVVSPSHLFTTVPPSLMFVNLRTRLRDFSYVYGPGSTTNGKVSTKLHWRRQGSGIVARGTLLSDQCVSFRDVLRSCSSQLVGSAVNVSAYRPRRGRFTRLDIRFAHEPSDENLPPYELRDVRLHDVAMFGREVRAWAWCSLGDPFACLSP